MFSKILICLLLCCQSNTILIDKIAAVVNEEIITLTDIDKAIRFFPRSRSAGETEEAFYARILKNLINWKVVYLEYNEAFKLAEEDYEEVQAPVIQKLGSLDELMAALKKFDMEWADFKEFIKEKVVYEKVLKEKFLDEIKIDFKEIEVFYNNEYIPRQKKLNINPKSLIEMAPLIEKQLKQRKARETSAAWLEEMKSSYNIENKLAKEAR